LRIESVFLHETGGKAERHGRVVGPFSRLQTEGPTTDHVADRLERARRLELQSRADRITDRKPEQTTAKAVLQFHL
jgi:hypothetical protein